MKITRNVAALGAFVLAAALLGSTSASAGAQTDPRDISVSLDAPLPLQSPTTDSLSAAVEHVADHASEWGISPSQLGSGQVSSGISGMKTVRFAQEINGLEVLGSLVAVTVSHDGSLLSYRIKTGSAPSDFMPSTSQIQAQGQALKSLAMVQHLKPSDLVVVEAALAIADSQIVDFVSGGSQLVWVVKVQQKLSPISTTTIYLNATSLVTVYSASSMREVAYDPSPLVCDLQLMDNSYAAVGQSRSLKRAVASISGASRKARSGESTLKGVSGSRVWLVAMSTYAGGVSTAYRAITIPKNGIATYSLSFTNVPSSAKYSLFVGTGKSRPTQSKMIRIRTGAASSRITGKVQGKLATSGTRLSSALLANGKAVSFLSLTGDTLPLCNYNNTGVTKTSTNSKSRIERANAKTYISQTQQYFANVIGGSSQVDIFSEMYLGNISPKLNFGRTQNCGTGQNANSESGLCTPRVSAFTNVCVYQSSNLSCPEFGNAFWTPWVSSDCRSGYCSAIFMGRGFVADDVIAHELAHGVSGYEAFNATMTNDADSLSEAYSDFFGEAYDQLNVRPGEAADLNWGMGEDVTGSTPGPFREMRETDQYGIPYYGAGCWTQNGDEHLNNGPADRFAWLISNGGDNSDVPRRCLPSDGGLTAAISVDAIGTTPQNGLCLADGSNCTAIKNMSRLVFAALPNISSAATYRDFGLAIVSACNAMNTMSPQSGWIDGTSHPEYCTQVSAALEATGIPRS